MNVLIAGGGTGGHVYPALALIEELRRRHQEIRIGYVGTAKGIESRIVRNESGIDFFEIEASGVERKLSPKTITEAWSNLKGFSLSLNIIAHFDPQVIVGTGGYVSFAPLLWGTLLRIPTLIHEQNRIPGLVNKLLAPLVDSVLVSFPETAHEIRARRAVHTGLPLRSSITSLREKLDQTRAREYLKLDPARPVVLVMGGTHGAQCIHDQLLSSSSRLQERDVQLVILAGRDAERLQSQTRPQNSDSIRILGHTHEVGHWMKAADLMVCRAGGATLAEMTTLGVPTILIPWPGAAQNHQEENASWLSERGACHLLRESECQGDRLVEEVLKLLGDSTRLTSLRNRCASLAVPNATERVLREVILHLEHGNQRETISLYRNWRRWNERLGVDLTRARSFRQRFGL